MTLDQFPFRELTTAAGIAAAGVLIRQIIEMAKGSVLPWLDAGNERKGAFILSALLYLAWLLIYGTDLGKDGPAAVAGFWACSTAALGANEAVDAAKGVVAKNVVATVAAPGQAAGGTALVVGAASLGGVVDPAFVGVATEPDEATIEPDGGQPLEAGPDVDLLVNGGDPVPEDDLDIEEDEEDEEPLDPATSTVS